MPRAYRDLRHYLDSTGTTQSAFARRVGVSQPYISQVLAGVRVPSFRVALRIASCARVPVSSLLVERAA